MLALALLGSTRAPNIGRPVAAAMTLLFGYMLVAIYWVKLILMYSGIASRTSLLSLFGVYGRLPALLAALNDVSLGPDLVVFVGAGLVTILPAGQSAAFAFRLLKKSPDPTGNERNDKSVGAR